MIVNELNPQLCTVAQLFDDVGEIYTVPVYQRNYAWRAEQIEQLISDVQDSADTGGAGGYFLGNLIVTTRPGNRPDFEVIDGQQRLTTLYLLLTVLAGVGDSANDGHRDRLRYESRPRATQALRRIDTAGAPRPAASGEPPANEETGIHEGYNVIRQYLDQHDELRDPVARGRFADYLRSQVKVVRAVLPAGTDLNRYFEIMNTRGQQLQQVDIVKARLMSHLDDDAERACFAWAWDACSDMDSYVQMSLTRGNTQSRRAMFGDNWSWLMPTNFAELVDVHATHSPDTQHALVSGAVSTLDAALATYATTGSDSADEDEDNVRFRSTIEFPSFLLHVLKLAQPDAGDQEGQLDDKRLILQFDNTVALAGPGGQAQWVRDFCHLLLKTRNLFDAFILKRQRAAALADADDWSLQRLLRRRSNTKSTAGYINTFTRLTDTTEEDGDVDPATRDVLLLQSMLRVTYTSPRTMHWITQTLRYLLDQPPEQVSSTHLAELLREHAREKVAEAFFSSTEPQGFHISRIVFTYLDYLLLSDQQKSDFRFTFRNSIEHFFPQHPDEQQSGEVVSPDCLNLFGNLALVSVGANSKFSNSRPKAKAENYRTTIEAQSPKLQLMAATTREQVWGDAQVRSHHQHVVGILRADLGLDHESPDATDRA